MLCLLPSILEAARPIQMRFLRAFGGNEALPPIIVNAPSDPFAGQFASQNSANSSFTLGSGFVTIEFDIQADILPNLVARFVHCDPYWREDDNSYINDPTMLRTSAVDWQQSPPLARYYSHRGRLSVPNRDVSFKFSGNWKAKIYDMDDPQTPLGEARFFVVDAVSECSLNMVTDLYRPKASVSPAAYVIEASVTAPANLIDAQLSTAVIYRNNRWFEPFVITQDLNRTPTEQLYNYAMKTTVFGFAGAGKRFRVADVPCQNEYRLLDLSNRGWFPNVGGSVRAPFADLRRNGTFVQKASDGAFLPEASPANSDDYVQMEFTFDPEAFPSPYDLFIAGSFNNWQVSADWKLTYDPDQRLYSLVRWVRRGLHNYMYATGRLGADAQAQDVINFEEYEGNAVSAGNTFIAFYYYREQGFGGYDRIVGVAARNPANKFR